MCKPGGIDVAVLFVDVIEDAPADKEPRKQQEQDGRVKHGQDHPHVVKGEDRRGKKIGKGSARVTLQDDEAVASEEKLLKE